MNQGVSFPRSPLRSELHWPTGSPKVPRATHKSRLRWPPELSWHVPSITRERGVSGPDWWSRSQEVQLTEGYQMPGHSLSPVAFSTTPSPIYNDLQNDCSRGTMVGNQCSGWCARQVKNMMKKKALKDYSKCICQARKWNIVPYYAMHSICLYGDVWGCMGQYLPLHRSKVLFRRSHVSSMELSAWAVSSCYVHFGNRRSSNFRCLR